MLRLLLVLGCWAMVAWGGVVAQAQDTPKAVALATSVGTLSLEVPADWLVTGESDDSRYVQATNRGQAEAALTDVQIVVRTRAELQAVTEAPFERTDNPAVDYLMAYAALQWSEGMGMYTRPIALDGSADYPTGAMLYLETATAPRFGESAQALLSLVVAIQTDEDEFALILLDGVPAEADALLPLWGDLLATVRLDGDPLPFTDETEGLFDLFIDTPSSLVERYEINIGPTNQSSSDGQALVPIGGPQVAFTVETTPEIAVPIPEGWVAESDVNGEGQVDRVILTLPDEAARITVMILPIEAAYTLGNPYAVMLDQLDALEYSLVGEPTIFAWDNRYMVAMATLRAEADLNLYPYGSAFILELSSLDGLVWAVYQQTAEAPLARQADWRNLLAQLRFDGRFLSNDAIFYSLGQLPPIHPTE